LHDLHDEASESRQDYFHRSRAKLTDTSWTKGKE
jgi:hypothetical protein